jgi:hypothetical protein
VVKKPFLNLSVLFIFLFLLITVPNSHAISIGFSPASTSGIVGSSLNVDLFISGLGSGTGPSIGEFDLDVMFDSNILGLSSVACGDQLDLFGLVPSCQKQ